MTRESWQAAIRAVEQVSPGERTPGLNWDHGWALYKLGRFRQARVSLSRAVAQQPQSASFHWSLGVVLQELNKPREAEAQLLASLAIRDSSLGRLTLALLYMEQKRWEEAEAVHLEGLSKAPDDRERVEAYGDFLSDCGREAEAQEQYGRALTLPERVRKSDLHSSAKGSS